jgi:hypothetical protein
MVAVGRDNVIAFLSGGNTPDSYSFLANVKVQEAANFALLV